MSCASAVTVVVMADPSCCNPRQRNAAGFSRRGAGRQRPGPAGVIWHIWLRREASCCIPGLAGRNLEDIPVSDGLLKIRKVKGTIACQETSGRADAYGRRAGKTRVIWPKLYCLNPNLQKG